MKNSVACLIIHGLAGNVIEIEPLEKCLALSGIYVKSVKLHGHGRSKRELANSSYRQWIQSAENELLWLMKRYSKIIIIGFSMGGLIAVNLINKYEIEGAVFINTPVYYWDIKRILKNLSRDFRTYSRQYLRRGTDKPLHSLIEFVKMLNKTKRIFRKIGVSSLILQALDDDTVHYKSANFIAENINGKKVLKFYNEGGHSILQSKSKDMVCRDVLRFIETFY